MADADVQSSARAESQQRGLVPFKPGQSGNPAGRPALPAEFKEKGPDALKKLAEFMDSSDKRIALRATEIVVERIYGKPAQPLEHDASKDMLDILAERISQRTNGHSEPA